MATRYVALLRAVNVGKRRVEMAKLKASFEALGFDDVWTYLNSGNVVFRAGGRESKLVSSIEERLAADFGFEIATLLRTEDELREIAAREPFGSIADGQSHHVVFLRSAPPAPDAKELEARSNATDRLAVVGREVHWFIDGKQLDSTLKDKDWRVLGDTVTTTRNTTMVRKLVAKLG